MNRKTLKKIAKRKKLQLSQTHVDVLKGVEIVSVFSKTKTLQALGYRFTHYSQYINRQTSFPA